MTSTGAAIAGGALTHIRRCSPVDVAPVFKLPLERPQPATLLDLLKKLDARTPFLEQRDRAFKVATCGERFFRARCGCGRRVLPDRCKDRLCPRCEHGRAARAVSKYLACFAGRAVVRHLVFTIRKTQLGQLGESIDFLLKALRRFRHYARIRGYLEGGTTSIETKGYAPGSTRRGWHTHAHVLAWGNDWLPIAALCLAWVQATGGRVNWRKFDALPERVQRAKAGSGDLDAILSTAEQSPIGCVERDGRGRVVHASACERDFDGGYRSSLREALKYATKGTTAAKHDEEPTAGWTVDMAAEFTAATRNRNLFSKFGDCPKVGELEPRPCERCGQPIEKCGGHHVLALSRSEAEQWAAELDPVDANDAPWTIDDEREYQRALELHYGRPAP